MRERLDREAGSDVDGHLDPSAGKRPHRDPVLRAADRPRQLMHQLVEIAGAGREVEVAGVDHEQR